MILRRLILPALLLAGLAFATADGAEASGITRLAPAPAIHAGGVHIGVGVAVPIGRRPVRRVAHPGHRYRVRPAGRWIVHEERVWVPGEMIGYDGHGHAIYTEGFWTIERRRVWVPAPRVYPHHGHGRLRPRGVVRVGAVFH